MSVPFDLRMRIYLQSGDHSHFEAMNDFICFQRDQVKDFTWYHGGLGERSYLDIEFHDVSDAILFKLAHG